MDEFRKISESLNIIRSCHIMIANELINCSNGDLGFLKGFSSRVVESIGFFWSKK